MCELWRRNLIRGLGLRTLKRRTQLPRVDGTGVVLVESGKGLAAGLDLLVRQAHREGDDAQVKGGAVLLVTMAKRNRSSLSR